MCRPRPARTCSGTYASNERKNRLAAVIAEAIGSTMRGIDDWVRMPPAPLWIALAPVVTIVEKNSQA